MDEIPEDVMQAAQIEAGRWFQAIGMGEYHFAEAIARAILAERDRCAKAAHDELLATASDPIGPLHGAGRIAAATHILSAIRKGA